MMYEAIRDFAKQLAFIPKIENERKQHRYEKYVVAGMGGSHLAGDVFRALDTALPLVIHSDYGLPVTAKKDRKNTLVIASSYSGNTEETLDAFALARKMNLATLTIATGGTLLAKTKKFGLPYVRLPVTGIQPRSAMGFSFRALAAALHRHDFLRESLALSKKLKPLSYRAHGKKLAKLLHGAIPLLYSSFRNQPIIYNWKIKFNETGKIPAFYNVVPELNHNEMTGFDIVRTTKSLSSKLHVLLMHDKEDHPQVERRLKTIEKLYMSRGLPVTNLELTGKTRLEKIFISIITADWTALETAEGYGVDADEVPMVEEFKKLI